MIEQYDIPKTWDNEKIKKEYNIRKSRLNTYRVSFWACLAFFSLGVWADDHNVIIGSFFMTIFAAIMERHTCFMMDAISRAFK